MDTRFAITEYPDAAVLTAELDALIKKPIYSINRTALKKYEEEYFEKKCAKSKEMITESKQVIPQSCCRSASLPVRYGSQCGVRYNRWKGPYLNRYNCGAWSQ